MPRSVKTNETVSALFLPSAAPSLTKHSYGTTKSSGSCGWQSDLQLSLSCHYEVGKTYVDIASVQLF